MMKNVIFLLLLALSLKITAQVAPPPPPPPPPPACDTCKSMDQVLVFAEEMPQFPGGEKSFQAYLINNVHYPDSAKKYGREGTVYVYFEVAKDGRVENLKCMKGVPGAPELCEEALRVFGTMPDWEPGKMNRKAVRVGMTVPLRFTLH